MADYKVISSDDHVTEPKDLWQTRGEPRFRDRAPRIVRTEDGTDWWFCDGYKLQSAFFGTDYGTRFEEPEKLMLGRPEAIHDNARSGGWIPEEHVKDMDFDGIGLGIVYPTVGLTLYNVPDSDLLSSILRTYNDWVLEFCRPFPKRLKGIAMLNLDDVQEGITEMERCAKLGFCGAMISVYPPVARSYDMPEYEPLWAAAEDLQMPLGLHAGTSRLGPGQQVPNPDTLRPSPITSFDYWVRVSVGHIIFSGVFERHPKLQIGIVEHETSWVPSFLDRLDYTYTQRVRNPFWHTFKEDMLPSDYFHRNVFLSFMEDAQGIRDRHIIGVDNLLWGSDYPHPESTFPRSREILKEILVECSEEEKAKIVGENTARIYHLS